jgi:CxxC-x17-CxxC domain-containing protein
MNNINEINFFAEATARGQRRKFGIKLDDRRRHMYVIGKTGMGKTQMLQNMAIQDVISGNGVGIIDPHGEFAEAVLEYVPKNRVNDVVYFNPADTEMPIGFNIMESVGMEQRYFIASGLMAAFKKIWVDVWSARMEYILNNALLALLEYPNATIMGANRMLADKDYRKKVVDNVKDPAVKSFWVNEFAKYPERYREEATGAIQNKIGQFISNPLIRNIVGQTKSTFNIRDIMDNKKIFIVNLSKGRIGEDNTSLLGTILITKLQIAAMSRVDIPEETRNDFFLYIDEFQTFATPSFAGILSEARKYRLCLVLAHQYIAQMDEVVRDAAFGNAGTLISFRVGAADAEFMESEFMPSFTPEDLVNLGKYNIAIKLMIDGVASNAFAAHTLPPIPLTQESNREKIVKVSRERYGNPGEVISEKISRWSGVVNREIKEIARTKETVETKETAGTKETESYLSQCWDCKREVKLNFKPDGKRPIYCRDCFEKRKSARQAQRRPAEISMDEAIRKYPSTSSGQALSTDSPKGPRVVNQVSRARKEVNLASLRQTLSDVLPIEESSGIMEEGKEVKFN